MPSCTSLPRLANKASKVPQSHRMKTGLRMTAASCQQILYVNMEHRTPTYIRGRRLITLEPEPRIRTVIPQTDLTTRRSPMSMQGGTCSLGPVLMSIRLRSAATIAGQGYMKNMWLPKRPKGEGSYHGCRQGRPRRGSQDRRSSITIASHKSNLPGKLWMGRSKSCQPATASMLGGVPKSGVDQPARRRNKLQAPPMNSQAGERSAQP